MTVDIGRIAFASREYRKLKVEDLSVQTRRPLATEMEYNTYLANPADATVFGGFILSLLKMDRYNWSMRVVRENYDFEIGDTIVVRWPRYGLDLGEEFIVKRIRDDVNNPFVEVALFGPRKRPERAAIWMNFTGGEFWQNGTSLTSLTEASGYVFSRTGEVGAVDADGTVDWFAADVPAVNSRGYHVYAAHTNYINRSQEYSTGWFLNAITATDNALISPDGTVTAGLITSTNTGNSNLQSNNFTLAAGSTRTYSIFAKAGASDWLCIAANALDTPVMRAWFNLSTGTVGTVGGASAYMVSLGNGWYRCVLVFSTTTDLGGNIINFICSGDNSTLSAIGNSIYVWQAQVIDGDHPDGGLLIRTTGSSVTVGASALEIAATIPSGDFIAWAAYEQSSPGEANIFSYSTTGAGTTNQRLSARSQVGVHLEFNPRALGVLQPSPSTITNVFGAGRNGILIGRRYGKYFSAARSPSGAITVRDNASGVGATPLVTAVDIGSSHAGISQVNGQVRGFYQLEGTFTDPEIIATIQSTL